MLDFIKKTPTQLLDRVNGVELFYDLIFVYCVALAVGLGLQGADDTLSPYPWGVFCFCILIATQVWFYTTSMVSFYGINTVFDRIAQIANMLIMYLLVNTMSGTWADYELFNYLWIGLLVLIGFHWTYHTLRAQEATKAHYKLLKSTLAVIGIQIVLIAFATAYSPVDSMTAQWICLGAVIFGFVAWPLLGAASKARCSFPHLVERCSLMIILTLGEVVVGTSHYYASGISALSPLLFFLFVAATFLVYLSLCDRIVDEERTTGGFGYMFMHVLLIFFLANVALSVHFVSLGGGDRLFSLCFLGLWLMLFFLVSLGMLHWSNRSTTFKVHMVSLRLALCALLFVTGAFVNNTDLMMFVASVLMFATYLLQVSIIKRID